MKVRSDGVMKKYCEVLSWCQRKPNTSFKHTLFYVVLGVIAEFHQDLIGVTGSIDDVKAAAMKFRIYVSKGPIDEDGDYIVRCVYYRH